MRLPRPTQPYIGTWTGFLYLAVVVDAFSHRVVGWAMATHLRAELVIDALNMAICDAGRKGSFTIRTRDRSTRPSNSASAAGGLE